MTQKKRTNRAKRTPQAVYRLSPLPLYQGNPFIEALEDYLSYSNKAIEEKLAKTLQPLHSTASRRARDAWLTTVLYECFIPLARHHELQELIDLMIRHGYYRRSAGNSSKDSQSLALVGPSGIGKSYAVCHILSLYDQIIYHDVDKEHQFTQIVYLKIECPHDGSIKGLAAAIIAEIDHVTGEDFTSLYVTRGRPTVSELKSHAARLLSIYNVGILVIDEIQNLSASRAERESLFNYIVSLSNTLGVPLMFIGTPKIISLMQTDMRIARRFGTAGLIQWDRLKPGTLMWKKMIQGLWQYNILPDENLDGPSEEVEKALYDCSQGITDLLFQLFITAEKKALLKGMGALSAELVYDSFVRHFGKLQPMIEALRSNDANALAKYADITIDRKEFIRMSKELSEQIAGLGEGGDEFESAANDVTARILKLMAGADVEITPEIIETIKEITTKNKEMNYSMSGGAEARAFEGKTAEAVDVSAAAGFDASKL